MTNPFPCNRVLPLAALLFALPLAGHAAPGDTDQSAQATAPTASASTPAHKPTFAERWYARVDKAQKSQPSWITPLATVTPRLEQEFRYDQFWQNLGNGAHVANYDGGKGLELIPTTTNEVIINLPPYENRTTNKPESGFGDTTILLIKQRLASANAENGNYIVTAFLGVVAPTGDDAFSAHAWQITPTIAGGKGYGRADVQATMGISIPTRFESTIGYPLATNVAFQYNVGKFWPEFEVNDTYWSGGERSGKNQVLLTPGIVIGRFKLQNRLKANFGVGYQFAVSPALVKEPITPMYNNAWIASVRVAF